MFMKRRIGLADEPCYHILRYSLGEIPSTFLKTREK